MPSNGATSGRSPRLLDIHCISDTSAGVEPVTQTYHFPDRYREFAFRAYQRGATIEQARAWSRPTTAWDVSGNCLRPVLRTLSTAYCGVPTDTRGKQFVTYKERYWAQHLDMTVRCRQCDNCRKVRAWRWRRRMKTEVANASRTWFTTLTLAPEEVAKARYAVDLRLIRSGVRRSDLHPDEEFAELVRELGP